MKDINSAEKSKKSSRSDPLRERGSNLSISRNQKENGYHAQGKLTTKGSYILAFNCGLKENLILFNQDVLLEN